jgi:transposase
MSQRKYVELTESDREKLEGLIRSGSCSARVQTRARILLLSDRSQGEQRPDAMVSKAVMTSVATVGRFRARYVTEGLESALYDKPRPGQKPKITGDIEAKLIALVCSDPPEGQKRWTLQLLADKMVELGYVDSLSHVAVSKRLKKTN